jgi:hypothetical protein
MWSLPNEVDDLAPKEAAENTQNKDDFCNVLQLNKAFNEFYWVRLPRRKVDRLQRGYLDPQGRSACHIRDKERLFAYHLLKYF